MRIQLVPGAGTPDFLELPWDVPLAEWPRERLVEVERGLGKHVVRFVEAGGSYFALKEVPPDVADREYRLLRALAEEALPAVRAVGLVHDRGDDLSSVLITSYLEYSRPYRLVLAERPLPALLDRLLDAMAELLVRLHLEGFFWGDCSLSNTLFRRDAGSLAAYFVDAETTEQHPLLSDGQRLYDVEIAEENVYGELLDLEEAVGPDPLRDPPEVAAEVRRRYEALWAELTDEEEFGAGERHRLEERLRRLNELGFDAEEVELLSSDGAYRLRISPRVVEPGHHRRRLLRLTGLEAQENQARRLLNDLTAYRVHLEQSGEAPVSETAAAARWLAEIFEPAVAAVPAELWAKREAAEVYHELLEHRWYLSERAGREVAMPEATISYVDTVLRALPDERLLR